MTHTVKGTTEGIRRSLKEGLLGDAGNVRACRTKSGPFEPVRGHPEFRDLVLVPTPSKAAGTTPPTGITMPPASASQSGTKLPTSPARPRSPTPSSIEESGVPHIELETATNTSLEWLKWGLVLIVAVATALLASLLFTH